MASRSTVLPTTVAWKEVFDDALVNDLKSLKRHIEEENFPLNQTNFDEETVAHIATKEKNLIMVKYLLDKEPNQLNVKDKWDQTILTVAIVKGAIDIVRYLVDELKVDIYDPHTQRFGNTAIHIAAEEGQMEVLKYLVEEKNVDPNLLNFLKEPPVFVAAYKPRFRVIKYLVEKAKVNVTGLDSNNDNILYISAMIGDLKVPKYLIDEKKIPFDINWQDIFGRTIVYVASRFNQMKFLKYCIEEKAANIHLENTRGWTPLFEASFVGNTDVIKYLLDKGADIYHKDLANRTVEEVASHADVVQFLNKTKHERSQRSRRSIQESIGLSFFPTYDSNSAPARTIIRLGSSKVGPGDKRIDNGSPLENFLFVANSVFRYAKGSFLQQRQETLVSPQEIVRARMDEIAVDAIDNFF